MSVIVSNTPPIDVPLPRPARRAALRAGHVLCLIALGLVRAMERARERTMLLEMSDAALSDIGLSRADAEREARRMSSLAALWRP